MVEPNVDEIFRINRQRFALAGISKQFHSVKALSKFFTALIYYCVKKMVRVSFIILAVAIVACTWAAPSEGQ